MGLTLRPATARAEDPAQYCRRAGTDDTLRPIPAPLVPAARRLFGLEAEEERQVMRGTVFRCANGEVLLCSLGANLPCGKGNPSRTLPGATGYCRDNPDAAFVPMYATGHDTIWRWRCEGGEARAEGPAEALDARGFIARLWRRAD